MNDFSLKKIEEAASRISNFIHRTAILKSESINKLSESEIFFKCENFQKIGAFKMRGALNAIMQLNEEEKSNGVVTHSSGNHAQAVALAAKMAGIKAYIVMPNTAPKIKVKGVESYGGNIHYCEPTLEARESTMEEIKRAMNCTFIPPYDHKDIILGQATAAKELIEDTKDSYDYLLCPVGGGGLLAGTALSTKYLSPTTKVIAAEPEGANDAFRSFKAKQKLKNDRIDTVCDGLLTNLGELNYNIMIDLVSEVLTATDNQIIEAMRLIWERMKIIVEPSCAVPLAVVLNNKEIFKGKKVGIILSGGNVDLDVFFASLKS